MITLCNEVIDTTKTVLAKSNSTNTVPTESTSTNFYSLLTFLLLTITLLIAVSIYCCFIKYRAKQKHLLPYCIKNNKLKNFILII